MGRRAGGYSGPIELLIVCTGNICRSPMAEAFLRQRFEGRKIDATVTSAGTRTQGRPATDEVIALMKERGLDVSEHRSQLVGRQLIADADLILCMAREHLREVVLTDGDAYARTFTLKELVRLGEAAGPRPDDLALAEWLRKLDDGGSPTIGFSELDDIEDPVGRRLSVHRRVCDEIEDLVDRMVNLVWPPLFA
jgi:protein-tyrosine phosphatase